MDRSWGRGGMEIKGGDLVRSGGCPGGKKKGKGEKGKKAVGSSWLICWAGCECCWIRPG